MHAKRSTASDHAGEDAPANRLGRRLRDGSILLSLCGVLACNALGFGLGRVICHGLLIAALGTPLHKS